ncbi:MAG: NHLP leader peptide family RiPP precursor [Alphaproteobacteria bacterium]|nr:NHLP leader peptide family RiPP precursor [Alphaproteobacteria bacterium]
MIMKTRAELDAELIARVADDAAFRAQLLENPKEAIQQATGLAIPADFTIQVHEENSMTAHVVLPPSGQLTGEDLERVAGGFGAFWG